MPIRTASTPPIRRGFPFSEFKLLDEARGTFEGYLAITGTEDQGGDIIEQGAFTKTLSELKSRQQSRHSRYILPIFWGHDPSDPIGGFTDAYEDERGLYVCGELDLDIEQGRRAYSGLKKGYSDGLSIGYFAVKAPYDRAGVRHLKEVSLFEGSITPVPMHPDALVSEVKSASGKSDWPLAGRDEAWDGAEAHNQIVEWATKDDGTLDEGKMKSVHFWYDSSAGADKITSYKLAFCYIKDGKPVAVPKGIFAVAGVLSGGRGGADLGDDADAVKKKVASYYARMRSEFDDKTIVAPWEKDGGGKGKHRMPTDTIARQGAAPRGSEYRKARDFDTLFQSLSESDTLQDDWGDTFIAFVRCMSELMCQAHYQTAGFLPEASDPVDINEAAQANVDAFGKAVMTLVTRSLAADFMPMLDYDGDQFVDPDGPNADEDDDDDRGYMARDLTTGAQRKAGRMMSTANHKEMGGYLADQAKALTAMTAAHKSLKAFHAKMSGDTTDSTEPSTDGKDPQPATPKDGGKSLTGAPSQQHGAGRDGNARDTTPQADGTDDLTTIIRERLKARLGDKRSA